MAPKNSKKNYLIFDTIWLQIAIWLIPTKKFEHFWVNCTLFDTKIAFELNSDTKIV
jgi:hypothetical protein